MAVVINMLFSEKTRFGKQKAPIIFLILKRKYFKNKHEKIAVSSSVSGKAKQCRLRCSEGPK